VNTLVIFTITLAGLAHELQKERDLSAVYVGNPSSGPQNVIVQRQLVDQVLVRYQARIGEANAGRYSERVRAALARVRQRLAGLDAHRQAIDARRLGLADSLGWYSDTIETLIRVEDVAAGEVDNRGVAGALAAEADGRPPSIELTTWFFATSAALDLLRRVQVELATATATASQASAAAADRRTATDAVGIVALAVILGLSLVMAGSMARPLRQLERAALEVAERRLPGMIERLQRGEVVDPDEEAAPLSMCSRDEIGQVARAFNEAHRVAARVATEHAALRKSIGDLFHNPARGSQGLIDR
jgi:HAMP domain-containing protein